MKGDLVCAFSYLFIEMFIDITMRIVMIVDQLRHDLLIVLVFDINLIVVLVAAMVVKVDMARVSAGLLRLYMYCILYLYLSSSLCTHCAVSFHCVLCIHHVFIMYSSCSECNLRDFISLGLDRLGLILHRPEEVCDCWECG